MNKIQVEIINVGDKERFTFLQGLLYKLKVMGRVLRAKRFLFLDVSFTPDFTDCNVKSERYRLSHKGVGEILKELGSTIIEYEAAGEQVKDLLK